MPQTLRAPVSSLPNLLFALVQRGTGPRCIGIHAAEFTNIPLALADSPGLVDVCVLANGASPQNMIEVNRIEP